MASMTDIVAVPSGALPAMMGINNATSLAIRNMQELRTQTRMTFDSGRVRSVEEAYINMGNTINYINVELKLVEENQKKVSEGTEHVERKTRSLKETFSNLNSGRSKFEQASAILDQYTLLSIKLNQINDGLQNAKQLNEQIYVASQRSRTGYMETANAVVQMGASAKSAFSGTDETIAFVEQMNKLFAINGADKGARSETMLKLSQAMAEGSLKGARLNEILATVPSLADNIETAMGWAEGSIQTYADQGMLTADVIKYALFASADEIDKKLAETPVTWAQAWDNMVSRFTVIAQPLLSFVNTLANYWDVIAPVIGSAVTVLLAYKVASNANNIVQGIGTGIQTAQAIAIAVKTKAMVVDVAKTRELTVAQWAVDNMFLTSPITWVVAGIILLIGAIYAVTAAYNHFTGSSVSATGIILGAVLTVAAVIANVVIGLMNGAIQFIWNLFVYPFIGIMEWVLNLVNGGFNNVGDALYNLIGQIITWFLGLGQVVTTIIDAITGFNWTAKLENIKNDIIAVDKNDKAITLDRTAPLIEERLVYEDVYNTGYNLGANLFNGFGDMGQADTFNMSDYDKIIQGIGSTADNTGRMDAMDSSEEDLKYLRDIAERETVNRFTTAEIKVDMANTFGDIRESANIDGVISRLSERLSEELAIAAEGVHV